MNNAFKNKETFANHLALELAQAEVRRRARDAETDNVSTGDPEGLARYIEALADLGHQYGIIYGIRSATGPMGEALYALVKVELEGCDNTEQSAINAAKRAVNALPSIGVQFA